MIVRKDRPDVSVELPYDSTAPRLARRLVDELVSDPSPSPEFMYDARLAVSELVCNAVSHGGAPAHLTMWRRPGVLRVEVTDTISTAESFFRPTGTVGGLGLKLVAASASDWGVEFHPAADGKTVWFEMNE